MDRIPDPIELMHSRMESLADRFVDEHTCMDCGKKVEYELICLSQVGDGPGLCIDCAGADEP